MKKKAFFKEGIRMGTCWGTGTYNEKQRSFTEI